MGMVSEFKAFIAKGNAMELAIGVIIGAAFGKIVNSLVEDIITPLLLNPTLKAAGVDKIENWAPGGVLAGKFLSAILSFIVIAFVLFLIVKGMNKMSKAKEEAPAGPTPDQALLTEIRDLLKK